MSRIEFDPTKDQINRRRHGISLQRFADMDPASQLIMADLRADYGEERWIAIGFIDARLHVAAMTYRGERTRVISLRRATRHEERMYAQASN